jgi:hypothetical protein
MPKVEGSNPSPATMGSSAGRRDADYVAHRRMFQLGNFPCWLASGPWCTRRGTTVEHDPPLSTFAHPSLWRGRYRPACPECQARQGAAIANARRLAATNWRW